MSVMVIRCLHLGISIYIFLYYSKYIYLYYANALFQTDNLGMMFSFGLTHCFIFEVHFQTILLAII